MPFISVVIPTFNRQNEVFEAIQSVLDQGRSDMEIIVVDDGSNDQTRQHVQHFGGACNYVYQSNGGPSSARNTGIKLAKGELISFLDSDDLWLPGKLDEDMKLLQRYPEIGALSGNADSYIEGRLKTHSVFSDRKIDFPPSGARPFCWSLPIMRLGPSCIMSSLTLRRSVLESLGGSIFDERLRFDEDWDFEFRLFSHCNVLLYEKVVCTKRAFDDGTRGGYSISGKRKSEQEQRLIWKTQASILDRYVSNNNWQAEVRADFIARLDEINGYLLEAKQLERN